MRRFHFDVRAGHQFAQDDDGASFADMELAAAEARSAVLEIARHRLTDGLDAVSVEVRDEAGRIVLIVTAKIVTERR